jgi:hypothetical protein
VTERWRKRLGDLDKQNPSDDLFERAKGGPQLPDEPISSPSTSTRIFTAVAAFLVFALAISVFAIPALRLKGGSGPASFGSSVQPLWPWRTVDEAKAWQADPYPVGSTGTGDFLSADATAAAFGREVLGWGNEVYAHEQGEPQSFPCWDYYSQGPSNAADVCYVTGYGSGGPTVAPYAPTTSDSVLRTFEITTCPPNATCDYVPPGPGQASIVVYQPIGSDGPWAVLEAKSRNLQLPVSPGATINHGSSLTANGEVPTGSGYEAAFALQIGSPTGAGRPCSMSITTAFESLPATPTAVGDTSGGLQLLERVQAAIPAVDLSGMVDRCGTEEPGYVFAVVASDSATIDGAAIDPLVDAGRTVYEFAAVPVIVHFPDASTETSVSPTQEPVRWTTYTDPLGWSIDVPKGWVTQTIDGSDPRVSYQGAAFGSAALEPTPGGPTTVFPPPGEVMLMITHREGGPADLPADDSTFPLSYDDLSPEEGGLTGTFRGDGLPFDLVIRFADVTDQQTEILRRMVESIRFQAWEVGDRRHGWTAVGKVLPASSAEWLTFQGDHYVASYDGTMRQFLGPAPACVGGGGSYEVRETGVAGVSCPDATGGDWDFTIGDPQPGNTAGFDVSLGSYPAIRTGSGTLLVQFPETQN